VRRIEHELTVREKEIDFGATGLAEIEQNLRTIVTTLQGSVPLDRRFGMDPTAIDAPRPVAEAKLTARILQAVRAYEPRVIVSSVTYQADDLTGQLQPIVRYRVKDGVI